MKHIFVLNPAAGSGKSEKKIWPTIVAACKAFQLDYVIHRTVNVGEATLYVRHICQQYAAEDILRFYVIGGDGTISEVATGLLNVPNAQMAVLPCGSGNDFCRMIGPEKLLLSLERQIQGTPQPVDAMRVNDRVSTNMVNIGLDGSTAAKQVDIKKGTFLRGTASYVAALIPQLIQMKPAQLTVTLENGTVYSDAYTLCAVGNGAYCGGGFKSLPKARVDDGLLDVSLVKGVNRREFFRLVGSYAKGTHLENPFVLENDLLTYVKCKSLTIETDGEIPICVDGEIMRSPKVEIEVLPKALQLVVPVGCTL